MALLPAVTKEAPKKAQYFATKHYSPERGLSCCFRQAGASSHCSKLHGYSLGVRITFGCDELDLNNWVVDFGALGPMWRQLQHAFDHKLVVAKDDPARASLMHLQALGVADVVVMDSTGCESFAKAIAQSAQLFVEGSAESELMNPTAFIYSVEVYEHGGNSASYYPVRGNG